MTLTDALTYFEAFVLTEQRMALNTWHAYRRDIMQFIGYTYRKNITDIEQLTTEYIKSFVYYLHKQSISARSIARKISTLRTFFGFLHDRYHIPLLTKHIELPRHDKKLPTYLSAEEMSKLLHAAQGHTIYAQRNYAMITLLYATGMRVSELINVQCSDISYDTGTISIRGKGNKERLVPLTTEIVEIIKKYTDTCRPLLCRDPKAKKKGQIIFALTPYLFPVWHKGQLRPMTRQAFFQLIRYLCKRAGIMRPVSPHTLRHSFATHMLQQGADLRSLQLLLGHEHLPTVEIYTHIDTSYLRSIYDQKHPRNRKIELKEEV